MVYSVPLTTLCWTAEVHTVSLYTVYGVLGTVYRHVWAPHDGEISLLYIVDISRRTFTTWQQKPYHTMSSSDSKASADRIRRNDQSLTRVRIGCCTWVCKFFNTVRTPNQLNKSSWIFDHYSSGRVTTRRDTLRYHGDRWRLVVHSRW